MARRNISLRIIYYGPGGVVTFFPITIEDGNYTAGDMVDEFTTILATSPIPWLSVSFDQLNGKFTFTGNQTFAVDTIYTSYDRPFDYGLGYNMGFTRDLHRAAPATDVSGSWFIRSDQTAFFAGDSYVLLNINDFDCINSQIADQTLTALAKIVLRDPKNYMTFDDYASQHAKEVVFPSPQDLSRFKIQLLDAYGNLLDMSAAQYSFSMEVLEVKNFSLYNTIRDSITLQYV